MIIMIGIGVDVYPLFAKGSSSANMPLWVPIALFANLPGALGNVYKEYYLKEVVRQKQ